MRNLVKYQRLIEKLNHELGPVVLSYLSNPEVLEVALNCDGKLWIKHQLKGYIDTNEKMDARNAHQLIGSIADRSNLVVNDCKSTIVTELPMFGFRFVGFLPPVVAAPSFIIRKPTTILFGLDDYLEQRVLSYQQAEIIRGAISTHESILVAGGPGTGKTTFANALLEEIVKLGNAHQRLILIEDTRELKCKASNALFLKTSEFLHHGDLLKTSLIASPDKIIVGECRGKEMLTLLKAWNTGTRGGLATIHSNSAKSALQRVNDLAEESGVTPSPYLICESINLIIALDFNDKGQRIVKEIVRVIGYKDGNYVLQAC